jgi:hypothetical protein
MNFQSGSALPGFWLEPRPLQSQKPPLASVEPSLFFVQRQQILLLSLSPSSPNLPPPNPSSTHSLIYSPNYRHHARLQGTSRYPIPELATRGGTHAISSAELTAIAQDVISGDEMISDSYDLETVDGVIYEANGAKITIGGESFDTGANASAEGGDEDGGDETKETKINIVHAFQLNETQFDKKAYLGHLKGTLRSA